MSATIGTVTWRTISFSASADSWSGQETRTMSAPARSSACTCSTVALTSLVTVLVIDCTVIGASPPTGTLPTWILRQARRWISRYGRTLIVNLDRQRAGIAGAQDQAGARHAVRLARLQHTRKDDRLIGRAHLDPAIG